MINVNDADDYEQDYDDKADDGGTVSEDRLHDAGGRGQTGAEERECGPAALLHLAVSGAGQTRVLVKQLLTSELSTE